MDLNEFNQKFNNDASLRTALAGSLAQKLSENGLGGDQVSLTIEPNADNTVKTLVVGSGKNDAMMELRVADAAMKALQEHGVNDFTGLSPVLPINPGDLVSWNVVYKDGGWVVNG